MSCFIGHYWAYGGLRFQDKREEVLKKRQELEKEYENKLRK